MKHFLSGALVGIATVLCLILIVSPRTITGPFYAGDVYPHVPGDDSIVLPTGQRVSAVREQRAGMDQLRVRAECRGMDDALGLLQRLVKP